jgi:hypothetical protein
MSNDVVEWKDIRLPIVRKRLLYNYITSIHPKISRNDLNRVVTMINLALCMKIISNDDIHIGPDGNICNINGICYDDGHIYINRTLPSCPLKYSMTTNTNQTPKGPSMMRLWIKYIKSLFKCNDNSMYSSRS